MQHLFTSITKSPTFLSRSKSFPMRRLRRSKGCCNLRLRQVLSVTLLLCLLTTTTPAAPKAVVEAGKEWKVSLVFWFYSSGFATTFAKLASLQSRPEITVQERQRDRDAKVKRIEIQPGSITLQVGAKAIFAAVAYDKDENAVGGIKWSWNAKDSGRDRTSPISQSGEFTATIAGTFKVTAEGAGKKAEITVTVEGGEDGSEGRRRKGNEAPSVTRQISSRDTPLSQATKRKQRRRDVRLAHASPAAPPQYLDYGWDPGNYWSADDPGNNPGDPPGSPQDDGAGSGNFQLAAPVLGLPGRGIDIALGLAYNSRLWNKAGSEITYDIDRGWPAPGWTLGFSKIMAMGVYNGSMIVEPDGTRRSYSGTATVYSYGSTFIGQTNDGSFIDYNHWAGSNGAILSAQARYPNGTVIEYTAPGPGAIYPTRITDANGNYVTITYPNNTGPRIQTITDTLGRSINFHYDYNNLLTAITGPGLNGSTRTLVRLQYRQLYLNYGFSGLTPRVRDQYPWVLNAIYYPATGTGYWFGDSDSYSSYGMLAKVVEQRGMGFSASSLNDQGTVTQGYTTRQAVYDYPLGPNYGLTDAPTYATLTDSWTRDGVNTDQTVTTYSVFQNSSPRTTTITFPDGSRSTQFSYNAPGQFHDGLVYQDEFYDASNNLLRKSTATWETGAYSSPRPTRTTVTDERNQTTATEFSYGAVYNQVTEVRDYDYNNALLRATRTQYENSSNYTNRHIFSLPKIVDVFASDNVTRVARTVIEYDGQTLTDAPNVTRHDNRFNPYAPWYFIPGPCWWECWDWCQYFCEPDVWHTDYDATTDYRGNVTQIKRYADALSLNESTALTETRQYDITGNMVTASSSCCEQTSVTYTSASQYAYPTSLKRGSPTDTTKQIQTSVTVDFNTGLTLTSTDANGHTSQTVYFSETLRPQTDYLPTGAYATYSYNDTAMTVTETTYTFGGAIANQNVKRLEGRGLVRREEALGQNSIWDFVDTIYDVFGRVSQQTRPYRNGLDTPQWSTTTYDALGRTKTVQTPDGSTSQVFYNEASRPDAATNLPGETTRTVDPWGRERWGRTDASGRLVEVVEPVVFWGNGSVSTGMATSYTYNTLGNLTQIVQGAQTRSFRYDSLGRLTAQKLAEMNATLNDAGTYVGSGTWSDVFSYDGRSNLISRTDARGVKTIYNYNNDPLNRLQSVSYDLSGFGDTANPIQSAPTVSYSYMTSGDVTRLNAVATSGVSTESFGYDSEGRLSSTTLTLTSRSAYPMAVEYIYDSLDRLTDVRYPAQYGMSGSPRKLIHHDFDIASRLSGLKVDNIDHASQIVYNASSQTTQLKVGVSGANQITENYGYNAQTGLLESQTVIRGASTTLLNLGYDYAGANGKRTGQLTKILNNLDHAKDRGYQYDALGRLVTATGGQSQNVTWAQRYEYDRYGNRSNVYSYVLEDYVKNFYQSALNRQPNSTELSSWLSSLRAAYLQGQWQFHDEMRNLGRTLFTSQEYLNRGRTNSEFVYDLYKAFLYREPDADGFAYWVSVVPINGRDNVRLGFELAVEFYTKVFGTSPYAPPAGVTIPRDGLQGIPYDQATNRINIPGWNYDAAGNQTRVRNASGVWQRFQYDAANRLVKVTDDYGATITQHTYGSTNQRLVTDDGNWKTYYAWSGSAVIAEYSEIPELYGVLRWQKNYIYLGGRLLSTQEWNGSGETLQFHHPDRLGTRLVTNPANGSSFEQTTLPFGTALASESTGSTNRRFTSYDRSLTTGLDYAVNRFYDSNQGRFTQVDPIGMKSVDLSNPQTLNLYAYCANDPINSVDPDGLGIISFFKKVFRAIGKAIAKIVTNKWVRLIAGIAIGVLAGFAFYWAATITTKFFLAAAINLAASSAILIVAAFNPKVLEVIQYIGAIASSVRSLAGLSSGSIRGTPSWNPEAGSGVGAISSFTAAQRRQRQRQDHVKVLIQNIELARRHLGARWKDFVDEIENNKNSSVSTALVLCHASQESSFLNLTDTGSGFIETTVGHDQEIGLLQIMPDTARSLGVHPATLTDVATNVTTGTGYLTGLIHQTGSLRTALGKYRGGSGPLNARSRRYADQILQCTKRVKY